MQLQALNKFVLPTNFRGRQGWFVQLWWLTEAILFRPSLQFMYSWRRFLLRLFGAKIGKNVIIRSTVHTQFPWKVSIGDNSWIGDHVHLYSLGEITIGSNVVISQKSYLCSGSHDYSKVDFPITNLPIIVEDECWIATDVFIASGVIIGRGTVVGARSSIFKSVPPGKVCIGNPAKVVKSRIVTEELRNNSAPANLIGQQLIITRKLKKAMRYLLWLALIICSSYQATGQRSIEEDSVVEAYSLRVTQNGGMLSGPEKGALEVFVKAAKAHQYWDKLLDVGPLCGGDLNAALVKLKYPKNGSPLLQNNGFTSVDYEAHKGIRLNAQKSINTNTNLGALGLQGGYGYSMWLDEGGGGWIGAPNSDVPYSMLHVNVPNVVAYLGFPPEFIMLGSKIPPHTDAFYTLCRKPREFAKLFVNGAEMSRVPDTLSPATIRNAAVEVFKDADNKGYGLFYALDDGTLTDDQVKALYQDVLQLLYDLGRKLPPPIISAGGLYSEEQTVTIKEGLINTFLDSVTIYYTTNGGKPTIYSNVYRSPFTVSNTTGIQAIAVKNGQLSEIAKSWVAIVPEDYKMKKYYTAHVMVNLLAFTDDMERWLVEMKQSGYNLIWAHLDDYTGNYVTTLNHLMETAVRVGDISVMPGVSWWVDPDLVSRMFIDTWNSPALFRAGNKRVYSGWDYQPDNQYLVDSLLSVQQISKDQYYLWVHSRYPYSFDEGKTWVGAYTINHGYIRYNGSSSAAKPEEVAYVYQTRPWLDGLINFAVDQGGKQKVIRTNQLVAEESLQVGKFSMAGVSSIYASVSFSDFYFKGAAEMWDSILALPPTTRPTAVSDITANDYAELSYIAPMVVPPVDGLSYIPPLASGFTLGNNIRYPLTDHSGIQKFLRPWAEAFKNNQSFPEFPEDRMFGLYFLHPAGQQPRSDLPSIFESYSHLNQTWWDHTVFASGIIDVGGQNQVEGIKKYFSDGNRKIHMAAHLTAPAQLKINDSVSDLMSAGAAYFEIEVGDFRGAPSFSIIRNGVEVKKGHGLQPITDDVFPGGWNFLSTEITEQPATFLTNDTKTLLEKQAGTKMNAVAVPRK